MYQKRLSLIVLFLAHNSLTQSVDDRKNDDVIFFKMVQSCVCKASLNLIVLSEQNVKLKLLHVQYIYSLSLGSEMFRIAWGERCRLLQEVVRFNSTTGVKISIEGLKRSCLFLSLYFEIISTRGVWFIFAMELDGTCMCCWSEEKIYFTKTTASQKI